MLTRSFLPESEQKKLLAYTPMFHARLFAQEDKYRRAHFQATKPGAIDPDGEVKGEPWLDGNPSIDRPLFVQFCANDPEHLLAAAKQVVPYCDAVDLNLGCPQGIARKGHYGAFLQEDQDLIFRLINTLHKELSIPVTAKIRVLETREATLAYAKNVLSAGASILTVHGRRREQKGHLTGLADWEAIRFLRDSLPPETVLFANGNILQGGDVDACLEATGADGVMSAEGNLSDPSIFGRPPAQGEEGREYWRGKDGKGGWRCDAVMRRYLDILHKYVEGVEPAARRPLFMPGDDTKWMTEEAEETKKSEEKQPAAQNGEADNEPPRKKRKKEESKKERTPNPNMSGTQAHLFHLLRHFVSRHTDIRDMLARECKYGLPSLEKILLAIERRVAEGLMEYERTGGQSWDDEVKDLYEKEDGPEGESSVGVLKRCKRPWWVVQPIVRPLPSEALAKGAIKLSKKDKVEQEKKKDEERKEKNLASVESQAQEKTDESNMDGAKRTEQQEDLAERDQLVSG